MFVTFSEDKYFVMDEDKKQKTICNLDCKIIKSIQSNK